MAMKRKTFWLDEVDECALQTISERYGCESESQAMRLALRVLANSPKLEIQLPKRPKHARPSPKTDPVAEMVERSAYEVLQEIQPSMLQVVGELLDKQQSPEQITEFVAAKGNDLLAGLVEMAAIYMQANGLRS
jgi:hypothetical protein